MTYFLLADDEYVDDFATTTGLHELREALEAKYPNHEITQLIVEGEFPIEDFTDFDVELEGSANEVLQGLIDAIKKADKMGADFVVISDGA